MEKKELVNPAFFGPQGLTAASANHIADIAKESYQAVEKRLSSMDFHKTTVALFDGFSQDDGGVDRLVGRDRDILRDECGAVRRDT